MNVYWMGKSYPGHNIWAADMTLPVTSTLISSAKLTTTKATIIYSGRQHANEVSSTSHIMKLAEELVLDPSLFTDDSDDLRERTDTIALQ